MGTSSTVDPSLKLADVSMFKPDGSPWMLVVKHQRPQVLQMPDELTPYLDELHHRQQANQPKPRLP